MTICVGIVKDGEVGIAADSRGIDPSEISVATDRIDKLICSNDNVIGVAGLYDHILLSREYVSLTKGGLPDMKDEMDVLRVVRSLRDYLKLEGRFLDTRDSSECDPFNFEMFVANRYGLWNVFRISPVACNFVALGSGRDIARGVYHALATYSNADYNAESMARRVVSLVCDLTFTCGGKVNSRRITLEGKEDV